MDFNKHLAKTVFIAFSGGMDTTALLAHLLNQQVNIYAISFNYGQKHLLELTRATHCIDYLRKQDFTINHRIISLQDAMQNLYSAQTLPELTVPEGHYSATQMKMTETPNRNAIFSAIVYAHALSLAKEKNIDISIALAVQKGDHTIYPDCRAEFYEALAQAFTLGNWDAERISFYLPYLTLDKAAILRECQQTCQQLGINFLTLMKNTLTCYAPSATGLSCGKCGSCNERLEAFTQLGINDPVDYLSA